jgi:CHAT domain-containing protein
VEAEARFSRVAEESHGRVRTDALRGQAQSQQLQGAYAASIQPLEEALALARDSGDLAREAAALGQLGNAHVALREPERAASYLEESVEVARRAGDPGVLAASLNNLGNHHAIERRWEAAREAYAESATHAGEAGDALRAGQALANAARVSLEGKDSREAAELLIRAKLLTRDLGGGVEAIALRIHLADSYARLAALDPRFHREGLQLAHRTLLEAMGEAGAAGDARLQSHVHGSLGGIYAQESGRDREALYLTNQALRLAEQAQAAELLVRWHAQAGRIQWRNGATDNAVASFARAVEMLEQTRPEARAQYGGAEAGFQRAVAPVYLALVDLLLQQAAATSDSAEAQARLRTARNIVERFKAAELRDYFQDECVAALEVQAEPAESLSPKAAVIYPIMLSERLELLVSRASGIERYTVAVSADRVRDAVQRFREQLVTRPSRRYLKSARDLHAWLLAPYAEALAEQGVDTLIVVPDGALRTIPWAALHDGERFAIERFAVAVTPSLDLMAPKPLDPSNTRLLLAGVSEPVQGREPLPYVRSEVAAIRDLYGGRVLLDDQFREDRLREELRERPPGVVHIASHAEFTGDPRTSYLLTHDQKLTMNELSQLVEAGRFGEEPLELLMLSACDTAAGDERAALGLAGVAVRAGARSAVGSLWSVNDEATSALIVDFYRELGGRALARAQQRLLAKPRFEHPFYWAGFLLINNWL